MKKIVTMVIIAALVLAAFITLSTQSVKAASSEVTVVSYSWYTAPSNTVLSSPNGGDFIVVGEIENVGSNIIQNVTLQGTALSSTGTDLAQTTTQAFVYHTLPGQKAPFYLDFNAASSSTDSLSWISSVSSVQFTVTSVINTNAAQYAGLEIPNPGGSTPYVPSNGTYYIDGTIVNNGTQVAQNPWVVATYYNSVGDSCRFEFHRLFN